MSTNIEWTERTWNPVVGCTPVSPGCLNCYAAAMARRLEAMGRPEYTPRVVPGAMGTPYDAHEPERTVRVAEVRGGRAVFTGDVRTVPERLMEPLKRKKPTTYFVNSMSDLFHEAVPFDFIDRVFAVMALCPQHTFQVLTKRPERMAEYTGDHKVAARIWDACLAMNDEIVRAVPRTIDTRNLDHQCVVWPLPNIWLGTSVENQKAADERIPHLLKCPAAVRFLSVEPLLGAVDLSAFMGGPYVGLPGDVVHPNYNAGLHWVIVGGESGSKARPCRVEWIRSIVRQCKAAEVPVFVKQLGANVEGDPPTPPVRDEATGTTRHPVQQVIEINDPKGGDMAEWPKDLRVREMPAARGAAGGAA